MAYYLKYRPQSIKELDLASAREDLTALIASDSLPHSFLFAGPKGTGKTSAARILAKVINCENRKKGSVESCNKCDQCVAITKGTSIDVIEMDAASHRGIDDIRALRDAVKLSPAQAKKKIYIIDEAHMLTTEASNALLKTLEEPPEHVVFILATTNPEKLIPTIRSRTTLIRFTKATTEEIIASLAKKVKGEKISVEKGALEVIAKAADGSFRDADKILEQLGSKDTPLTREIAEEKLNQSGAFDPVSFLKDISERNVVECLKRVSESVDAGVAVETMIDTTVETLRHLLLERVGASDSHTDVLFEVPEIISLTHLFIRARGQLKDVLIETIALELAIVEWCESGIATSSTGNDDNTVTESAPPEIIVKPETPKIEVIANVVEVEKAVQSSKESEIPDELPEKKVVESISVETVAPPSGKGNGKNILDKAIWAQVLAAVRLINASTEALLRASMPIELKANKLKLGVYYSFHKEHLESHTHKSILEEVCAEVLGTQIRVECLLTQPPAEPTPVLNTVATPAPAINGVSGVTQTDTVEEVEDSALTEDPDEDIIRMAKEIFGE